MISIFKIFARLNSKLASGVLFFVLLSVIVVCFFTQKVGAQSSPTVVAVHQDSTGPLNTMTVGTASQNNAMGLSASQLNYFLTSEGVSLTSQTSTFSYQVVFVYSDGSFSTQTMCLAGASGSV